MSQEYDRRDFIKYSSRARPKNPFVGNAKQVADGLEEWFETRACDGFARLHDVIHPVDVIDVQRTEVQNLHSDGSQRNEQRARPRAAGDRAARSSPSFALCWLISLFLGLFES